MFGNIFFGTVAQQFGFANISFHLTKNSTVKRLERFRKVLVGCGGNWGQLGVFLFTIGQFLASQKYLVRVVVIVVSAVGRPLYI